MTPRQNRLIRYPVVYCKTLTLQLQNVSWDRETLEGIVAKIAADAGLGLGKIAGPIRAALAGRTATPSVFDMMLILGQAESLARLEDAGV